MTLIPNMRGKSWAMLHSLFQNWLVTNFSPESMPDSETCLLMWVAWRESHEIHIASYESRIEGLEAEVERGWCKLNYIYQD